MPGMMAAVMAWNETDPLMLNNTLPAHPTAVQPSGWQASLNLAFDGDGQHTVPTERRHFGPLRALKGLLPEGPDLWHQVIVHPPGGIASGDALAIDVTVTGAGRLLVTSPGAAKWYRCQGTPASQRIRARVADGASLEWMPAETIFFRDTDARLDTRFDIEGDGRLIHADLYCLGRPAVGERFDRGTVRSRFELHVSGVLRFAERLTLQAGSPLLDSPSGLGGFPLTGILLAYGPQIDDDLLARCRGLECSGQFGASRIGSLLIIRWRGATVGDGWSLLRSAWALVRPVLLGRAPCPPRIWAT